MGLFNRKKEKNPSLIVLSKSGKKFDLSVAENGTILIDEKPYTVEITTESDCFSYISYGNRKYPFEIISRNEREYHILVNGVEYQFTIETPYSFQRKKLLESQRPATTVELFAAPMPGKVIEVLAEEGAVITEGTALIILEAMKMQNELLSHVSGKVKKVSVKKGQNVMKDDLLLEIDTAK